MAEEALLREILQRLARVEEATENHIPTRLGAIEGRLRGVDGRVWALVFAVAITLMGVVFNALRI